MGSLIGGCLAIALSIAPASTKNWSIVRLVAPVAAIGCFLNRKQSLKNAIAQQRAIDSAIAEKKQQQRELAEATRPIIIQEEIDKQTARAAAAVKDFALDADKALATSIAHKHPEWARQQVADAKLRHEQALLETEQVNKSEPEPETEELIVDRSSFPFGVELPIVPDFGVKFFDWADFRNQPENYTHIRAVAPTNGGKTMLVDWLLDVFPSEKKFVVSIKRKPHQWRFLDVVGVPEDYVAIRSEMLKLQQERIDRTVLMADGIDYPYWSVAFDEWKAIAKNIKAIVENKQVISPSARDLMGEYLTLCRELKIRIFALAQGRQVITWGLEGESDLAECFCSIYMGKFAVEECESYCNRFPKDSEEYTKYQKVRDYLESFGKRSAWISSEVGEFPAIVPDLSKWQREDGGFATVSKADLSPEIEPQPKPEPKSQVQTEPTSEELLEVAKKRLLDAWNAEFLPIDDFPSSESDMFAVEVQPEFPKALPEENSSLIASPASTLPEKERTKALARVFGLMRKYSVPNAEVEDAIELIPIDPDKALWLSLKILQLGVTQTSTKIFMKGNSGRPFLKSKEWYSLLESKFGKITDEK
ncbi:MAG: hypothetical protein EAZ69_00095 [Oscillatoriales cyanobacterium]|nr:MAG: hypothetical protein EAZ69_00095 [Oscillatoriales cyanobacterium]